MDRVAALLVFVFALMGLCLGPCVPTELQFLRTKRAFRSLDHPDGSVVLAAAADRGLLEGNGNHCDFFAGELRVVSAPAAALRSFYPSHVEVQVVDSTVDPQFLSTAVPRDALVREGLARLSAEKGTLYVVSLSDQHEAGLDLRCH